MRKPFFPVSLNLDGRLCVVIGAADDREAVEKSAMLEESGLTICKTQGVSFNPIAWDWVLSSDVDVNYMVVATRP